MICGKISGNLTILDFDEPGFYERWRAEVGENLKYIQTQLGHSSLTVTLNVYAHLMKPANQEAACRLENSVFGESGSKMVAGKEKGSRSKAVTP